MVKDYSGRQTKPSVQSASRSIKQWLWVLVAFSAGYALSAFYDVDHFKGWVQAVVFEPYIKKHAPAMFTKTREPLPKPKFEFYTMLAKGESGVVEKSVESTAVDAVSNASQVVSVTTAKQVGAKSTEQYIVQLAAFSHRTDAEKMKAALLLKGIRVDIAEGEQNNLQWYRVNIGPFSTREAAEAAQREMVKSERLSGMVRKASA